MDNDNIIDIIYGNLGTMTATDQKVAQAVLADPKAAVNYTISELAKVAQVSEASISRFCKNLTLTGFHQLKIQLAKVADDESAYYDEINIDNVQQALTNIKSNKIAEISNTLAGFTTPVLKKIMTLIDHARILQIAAEGNTYPVVSDAVYRFNQIGIMAIGDESWSTSIGQTLNLTANDVLLVISNSGESKALLKQIEVAHQRGMQVISITNRKDSPIALQGDLHLRTSVRQHVLNSDYYFSRVAAMTATETLFLLLIAEDRQRLNAIQSHENIISTVKI
ncbi:MurR/RpiR family transcriptional regulator [Lactiplantibacillus plantarum]|uniref:MurR/RpiR family transcriptional regulator n=1 Tax=Lactiplantibacillus plantarum TaxID=1590 RepID=UPI0005DCD7F0|nr:MurR/RpiR family transcriptional regulator [Lactiplantibacillus plantarum]MBS0941203.1 MurR/RpiR family transcriptional regulator [Lactiplantibacillus plantarum]MCK8475389.1 MurR/RpiR family transcriptional regulator [Lactiplantibacillus plantarum]WHQ55848.1 MurR/RpiR family transcriptional regulator [Lactiplantibacillus plantarum]WIR74256.1 MurR/RpiR family transcriptional regulator [Lactiplantibacillus plantarum]CDN29663.1 transcriptional regulator [Lactiplantibacillus plantarum]